MIKFLYEDLAQQEIVINTVAVQYRVSNNGIHCMLVGGHKFEIDMETLDKINKSVSLTINQQSC